MPAPRWLPWIGVLALAGAGAGALGPLQPGRPVSCGRVGLVPGASSMTNLAGLPTDPLGCFAAAYRVCRPASLTVELDGVDTYRQIVLRPGRSHGQCRVSEDLTFRGEGADGHSTGACARAVLVPAGLLLQACGREPDWTIEMTS